MLRYEDTDDKEQRCIIPPFTHEPVRTAHVLAVTEQEASAHHDQYKDAHDHRCGRAVPDQLIDQEERQVQDRDLDDVPHVVIDQRPSRKYLEQIQGFILGAADAGRDGKYRDTRIERDQDRYEAFPEEAFEIVFLRLQAGIKAEAREEEEYADEEHAAAGQEFERSGVLHKILRQMVKDDRNGRETLDRL